ncbi:MAG TPA: hypothetical protein EYP41_03245 [Anaerolineae bacterium]|nr:hypothetical protein [Anaerolineae bacterium]HIP72053.1 hypothetical protein [Anaerolineae bacterium]
MKINKTIFTILLLLIAGLVVACGSKSAPEAATPPANEMETMPDTEMDTEMEDMEDGEMEGMDMNAEVPADLDTSLSRPTEQGVYQVTISSELDPLSLNEIHNWIIHVAAPDGTAVTNAEITIDGGMPAHQHGFPTAPQVTENLGNGDYKLEGVKFSMAGWWEMRLDITADGQSDSVTFNIVLP